MAKTATIKLGNKHVTVQESTWAGERRLDIREMYMDKKTGELKFSKSGISVPFEAASSLVSAIKEVCSLDLGVINALLAARDRIALADAERMDDEIIDFGDGA